MVDSFSRFPWKERVMGSLTSLQIPYNVQSIYHSQFADNMMHLGGTSEIISRIFKGFFNNYIEVLGAKVNNIKSKIYGWNFSNHGKQSPHS